MSAEQVRELLTQASESLQNGLYDQALDQTSQAMALDPANGEAKLIRAIALSRTGQTEQAMANFRSAIAAMPQSPEPHAQLAVHLHSNGQPREALEEARAALALDPSHMQARSLAARIEQELGGSTTEAPPAGNYQASPYAAPQGEYSRHGQPVGEGIHHVAFVRQMGEKKWDTIGLVLVIMGLLMTVYSIIVMAGNWGPMMEAFRTGNQSAMPATTPFQMVMQIISWIGIAGSIGWVAADIADRKGNWLWMVAFIICCCCAPIQAIYYFLGRKR